MRGGLEDWEIDSVSQYEHLDLDCSNGIKVDYGRVISCIFSQSRVLS